MTERVVPMRLQKFLARAGVASRRGSEDLMTAGRVTVNGEVTTELGSKVDPLVDTVAVDGAVVTLADTCTYLVLNKPAGYLTTMDDPQGRPTVATLMPTTEHPGLFPVGRLDMDTTGALLFMTDGELAASILHPSFHVPKRYIALVDGTMGEKDAQRLREGIELDDGPTAPARAEILKRGGDRSTIALTLTEGRKRQVKRMCSAVGHPVVELHRERFGVIGVEGLAEGEWRELTKEEVTSLRTAVAGKDDPS